MFRIIPDGKEFREYVLLRDGQGLWLRMATPADVAALEGFFARASRYSLQMRFMGGVALVPRKFIEELCASDGRDRACVLAVLGDDRVVGVGNYAGLGTRHTADVAFIVDDEMQGKGISTLLLERLAGLAAAAGFVGFEADVLLENQAMIQVFRDSGFEARQILDGGSYHVHFPVRGAAAMRERAELRERNAAANSLARLLRPKVVAVVGASRQGGGVGRLIFEHILSDGFTGTVYPVNNRAASVHGVRAYPSLSALPEVPDLVVVAVRAKQVCEVVEEATRLGVKGLVVVTAGFAEIGSAGAERQARLLEIARQGGARVVGPNCLGLLNTDPEVRLNASLAPSLPPAGRIGFFSHSAALGTVILQYAAERGLGFSTFVSAGNRADVSGNDILMYWEEDPATDIAMLYLETFGNPRKFARIARRLAVRKPVLCVKSARSRAGRRVARAHIGARPVQETDVELLFRQAGVVRLDTLEELFDVAVLLATQPLPQGPRVAVIGNSGGVATITADACDAAGLDLGPDNVVNLGPAATPEGYREAVERCLSNDAIDAVIAIFLCVGECQPDLVARGIRRGVASAQRGTGVRKPVLMSLMGAAGVVDLALPGRGGAHREVFPSYRFPESAARALARAVEVAEFRRRPPGRLVWDEDVDAAVARRGLGALFASQQPPRPTVEARGSVAAAIVAPFGMAVAGPAAGRSARVQVQVRSDPDFGPLLSVRRKGRPWVVRVTPLTDLDVDELLAAAGVEEAGVAGVVGRISQLVEELPWLESFIGTVVTDGDGVAFASDLRLVFARGGEVPPP